MNSINQAEFDDVFRKISRNIYAHLKPIKEKGENFDPNRNTGYVVTKKNPLPIKAVWKPISASSLTYRELGLTESGALEVLMRNNDLNLIKISEKVIISGREYYAFNSKVGNKLQLYPSDFSGYSKVVLFLQIK